MKKVIIELKSLKCHNYTYNQYKEKMLSVTWDVFHTVVIPCGKKNGVKWSGILVYFPLRALRKLSHVKSTQFKVVYTLLTKYFQFQSSSSYRIKNTSPTGKHSFVQYKESGPSQKPP